jgi:hypothetical protein
MAKFLAGTRVTRTIEKYTFHGTVLLGGPMYTVAEDDRQDLYCWPVAEAKEAKP